MIYGKGENEPTNKRTSHLHGPWGHNSQHTTQHARTTNTRIAKSRIHSSHGVLLYPPRLGRYRESPCPASGPETVPGGSLWRWGGQAAPACSPRQKRCHGEVSLSRSLRARSRFELPALEIIVYARAGQGFSGKSSPNSPAGIGPRNVERRGTFRIRNW